MNVFELKVASLVGVGVSENEKHNTLRLHTGEMLAESKKPLDEMVTQSSFLLFDTMSFLPRRLFLFDNFMLCLRLPYCRKPFFCSMKCHSGPGGIFFVWKLHFVFKATLLPQALFC